MANFLDTFSRTGLVTAAPTDSGHMWADLGLGAGIAGANPVAPVIVGGALTATGGAPHYWSGTPNWTPSADHSIAARFLYDGTNNTFFGQLGVRANNATTAGYFLQYAYSSTPNKIDLFLYGTDGSSSDYGLFSGGGGSLLYTVADKFNFLLELRVVGSTISAWIDGVQVDSCVNTRVTSGGTIFIDVEPGNATPWTSLSVDSVAGIDLAGAAPTVFWTNKVKTSEIDT